MRSRLCTESLLSSLTFCTTHTLCVGKAGWRVITLVSQAANVALEVGVHAIVVSKARMESYDCVGRIGMHGMQYNAMHCNVDM
jgi:hypothetical protein